MRAACFWSIFVQIKSYQKRQLFLGTLEELDACMMVVKDKLARRVTAVVTLLSTT